MQKKIRNNNFLKYIIFFFIINLLIGSNIQVLTAKTKHITNKNKTSKTVHKSNKKIKSKSSKKITKSGKKKTKKRRTRYYPPTKIKATHYQIVTDSVLVPGVYYRNVRLGNGKKYFSVHIIEADIINSEIKAAILKAKNSATELEKLQDMVRFSDSTTNFSVLGAVNGNFWKAYYNSPIGPTVINGEVVELKTHKQWTSGFFDEDSKLYIDNFFMNGLIIKNDGYRINIDNVNRRYDSTGVIIYNHFAGDSIPYVSKKNLEFEVNKAITETLKASSQDSVFNDSTEVVYDTLKLKQEFYHTTRTQMIEYSLPKYTIKYLEAPGINKKVQCIVVSRDTGAVAIPSNGFVLSFGTDFKKNSYLKTGDTIGLNFYTNVNDDVVFVNSVSGTPRLVRNGVAKQEAIQEGSRGRRFISMQLPRTAIGTDKFQRKIYLVAIENTNPKEGKYAANLDDMATIMKQIGAYNAMNLDGGGSTIMVLGGKNVLNKNRPESSRRLSVGVAIVLKNSYLKELLKDSN
ncbi:MAG: phosphodiester glycosidase family protein [FCB group bacterium]|jgi:exopolysaccharide biosynthesis protein